MQAHQRRVVLEKKSTIVKYANAICNIQCVINKIEHCIFQCNYTTIPMKEKLKAWFGWMQESNRFKHCIAGFLAAAICGIGAALTAGVAAEYKDWCYAGQKGGVFGIFKSDNGFDWFDLLATAIGGFLGALFHYFAFGHLHL